ncbi:MAG TPA: fused MFS/spermidine synthase [Rhizomicrobium sp.]|nr:fused MFS/spermidine synthase [Rhizomicrobium sp.]
MKHARNRPSAPVIVQDNATGGVSYWDGRTNQSEADENGVSLADYIHAMFGFLVAAKARDVLMIGCGGGTLATMLRRVGIAVTIVDISARSFTIARRYFHLPDDVATHVAEGAAFLRRHAHRYDAIVLDAYDDEAIPKHFLTRAFFDLAKKRMKPRGALFLLNIIVADDADRTPDDIARLMQKTWRNVRLLDSDGWLDRNSVAAAGAVAKLKRPTLLMPPARGAKKFAAGLKTMKFRKLRR